MAPDLSSHTDIGPFLRRLALLGLLIAGLLIAGAVAYATMESSSLAYGLVWALDTVTTVGAIPEPASSGARTLKSVVEILGIGTLFYGLVTVAEFFVAGHLGDLLNARRMQKMIDSLTEHHIVCGYGRVGRQVVRDLRAAGATCVVVDSDPAIREATQGAGVRFVQGDATNDSVLLAAGVERARSLIACADSDTDNVFITLTARLSFFSESSSPARATITMSGRSSRAVSVMNTLSVSESAHAMIERARSTPAATSTESVVASPWTKRTPAP